MTEKQEYHPCSKEKGFCVSLERVTQPDSISKGLSFFSLFNYETTKRVTLGVVYKESPHD